MRKLLLSILVGIFMFTAVSPAIADPFISLLDKSLPVCSGPQIKNTHYFGWIFNTVDHNFFGKIIKLKLYQRIPIIPDVIQCQIKQMMIWDWGQSEE